MKREEEITNEAKGRYPHDIDCFLAFIKGGEYADRTMLDRACEWLELRVSVDFPVDTNECGMPLCESWIKAQEERIKAMKEFITDFRQAMEGGAE